LAAQLFFLAGEDHHMRLRVMPELKARGYRVTAAASRAPDPFLDAGVEVRPITFNRFVSPLRDLDTMRRLSEMLKSVDADIAHCFDTKLNLMVPFAAGRCRTQIVRTIRTIKRALWDIL